MTAQPTWTVASAKARLSEVIDNALKHGPQRITKNGRPTAIVVSIEEWERKTKPRDTLVEFFAKSPLRGSGIDLERLHDKPRDIDL